MDSWRVVVVVVVAEVVCLALDCLKPGVKGIGIGVGERMVKEATFRVECWKKLIRRRRGRRGRRCLIMILLVVVVVVWWWWWSGSKGVAR